MVMKESESGLQAVRPAKRSEEYTSELQSPCNLVCRLLLEKKKTQLERFGPRPPAKTDALDVPAYQRRNPDLFVGLGHGVPLPHLLATRSSATCPIPRVAQP